MLQERQNLSQVDAREHLELPRLRLQLIKPLAFGVLVVKQLLFVSPLPLELILQPLTDLLLSGYLLLSTVNLSLQDFLPLLALCQLLPQGGVGSQLLLEIVDFELMSLGHQHLLELVHQPLFPDDVLQSQHLLSGFFLIGLQSLELRSPLGVEQAACSNSWLILLYE